MTVDSLSLAVCLFTFDALRLKAFNTNEFIGVGVRDANQQGGSGRRRNHGIVHSHRPHYPRLSCGSQRHQCRGGNKRVVPYRQMAEVPRSNRGLPREVAESQRALIEPAVTYDTFARVDFAIEAVPESLDLKEECLRISIGGAGRMLSWPAIRPVFPSRSWVLSPGDLTK